LKQLRPRQFTVLTVRQFEHAQGAWHAHGAPTNHGVFSNIGICGNSTVFGKTAA
jgi:hypothetical protein